MKVQIMALLVVVGFTAEQEQQNPISDGWLLFEKVTFKATYFSEYDASFLVPNLSTIKRYEGHEISIKGHFIPFELEDDNTIIISKFPYAACFFCGGAGPESVVEVRFKSPPIRFKPDQILEVTGKLVLNDTDVNHLNFIIENPKLSVQ